MVQDPARARITQRLLGVVPVVIVSFWLIDVVADLAATPLTLLARLMLLTAFPLAAYAWPRLGPSARQLTSGALGALSAISMYLMVRETGGSHSLLFAYFWLLPIGMTLMMPEHPQASLISGVVMLPLSTHMLHVEQHSLLQNIYHIAQVSAVTATAVFANVMHQRLHRSDLNRVEGFLQSLPVAVIVTDAHGKTQYVNDKARAMGSLVVRDTEEPYPSERQPLVRALHGETSAISDAEALREDGRVPVEVFGTPIKSSDGSVQFAMATISDIGHRLDTERALHLAQSRDRAIYLATNDVIWEWNLDDGEMTLSDRVSEIVGVAQTKMRREEWMARVHLEDRVRVQHSIAAALGSGAAEWKQDYRLQRRDGSYAYVMDRAAIVRGDGLRVIGALRDVSEMHQLQSRLAQADRMSSLGTLAAVVAHEINNPLAFVLANMEYVLGALDNKDDESLIEALTEARVGVDRIKSIVKDLKAFSRSDGEAIGPVDLQGALESALMLATNEIRHRARLVRDLQFTPQVVGTQSKLGQVFLNLIVNAAQAIPDGKKDENEIRVSTRVEGNVVVVEVADTGSGMPEHVKRRIFEPFFTTKPQGVGTGLGLSICHGIMKSFGGDISVDSEPGKGTTFRLTLQIAEQPAKAAQVIEAPSVARRRVLVVDDEPFVLSAVTRMFRREHDIVAFDQARAALAWLQAGNHPDVLLCDVMMPHMSGQEFYSAVPAELRSRMVFITGGAFSADAKRFFDGVSNPTVAKPFDRAALLRVIESVATSAS